MNDNMLPAMAYLALLVAVVLLPFIGGHLATEGGPTSHRTAPSVLPLWTVFVLGAGAVFLSSLRGGGTGPWPLLLLVPLIRAGTRSLLGGLVALLLFAPAIWWMEAVHWNTARITLFMVLALIVATIPEWKGLDRLRNKGVLAIPVPVVMAGLGLAWGLWTSSLHAPGSGQMAWHHWGAYIAPVDALLSGGIPYRDFPVQYGLGPTLLVAGTCGNDCWQALYRLTVVANAVHLGALALCATVLLQPVSRGLRALMLVALFCATMLWTGFPVSFASPVATPSVGGLRFLGLSGLLATIAWSEASGQRRDWIGHVIWAINMFWSAEAAFFGSALWWPYLALRDAGNATGRWGVMLCLIRRAIMATVAVGVMLALLGLVFRVWTGIWLPVADFVIYLQHPPGPMPINLQGPLWLAMAAVLVACLALIRVKTIQSGRLLYACLLVLVIAGSYYISRSHDNNILNLFPFFLLLLCACLPVTAPDVEGHGNDIFLVGFVRTIAAAMVGYIALFGGHGFKAAWEDNAFGEVGAGALVERFSPGLHDTQAILDKDAITLLASLPVQHGASVLLFDKNVVSPWSAPGMGWTGMNNIANFRPLPAADIARYIARGAATYHRPGWIVVQDGFEPWRDLFMRSYRVDQSRTFGKFTAYHLVPR